MKHYIVLLKPTFRASEFTQFVPNSVTVGKYKLTSHSIQLATDDEDTIKKLRELPAVFEIVLLEQD